MSVNRLPKPDVLKDSLINYDESSVTGDQVLTLLRIWPKDSNLEDLEKENKNKKGNEVWDKAEGYFLPLCDPPSIHARLKMWKFKINWDEELSIQKGTLETQKLLYKELKTNKCILKVLSMALAIGNILNGDTAKGQADGFDMTVLSKLTTIKDNSGQSMLQYICAKIKAENDEFTAEISKLITMFNTKKTDISIAESKAGEL